MDMPTSDNDRLGSIERKLDEVYRSVEKVRKYFLIMLITAAVTFVLPLIGLAFAIPAYLRTLSDLGGF